MLLAAGLREKIDVAARAIIYADADAGQAGAVKEAISITSLGFVPVKGLQFMPIDTMEIGPTGPHDDRTFLLIEQDGGLLWTARTPALARVVPHWDGETLRLRFPDGEVAGGVEPGERVEVGMWGLRMVPGRVCLGVHSDALSDYLGRHVRLVQRDPAAVGTDDSPVSLMSEASVTALAARLNGTRPDPWRFRMNITVDGLEAWSEEALDGRELAVRDVVLRVGNPIPRCVVTTHDPKTGERDLPVLKAIAQLRGKRSVNFGVGCDVVRPGVICVGDLVKVAGEDVLTT